MNARFLLIAESLRHHWQRTLVEALAPLGDVEVRSEDESIALIPAGDYDVIIADAAEVEDVVALISAIRAKRPDAAIVVATASPTWTRARAAFQAGAADYIPKSMGSDELRSTLEGILACSPHRPLAGK